MLLFTFFVGVQRAAGHDVVGIDPQVKFIKLSCVLNIRVMEINDESIPRTYIARFCA